MTAGPSLQEVQRWMKGRILAGESGDERMSIYSGGYIARIQEALEEAYPAVRHVLGARSFSELSRAYAARHPSRDYNLSLVGRNLPSFLETFPLTKNLPFLPDLARLEWLVTEAFHAFDQPPLDPAALAAIPPEDWDCLRVIFQPSVRRLASAWPVLDIWEARDRPVNEVRIDLINRPQRVLAYRSNLQVRCELLDERQDKMLAALMEGETLGAACERIAETTSGDPPLAEWFARWAGAGLIAGI